MIIIAFIDTSFTLNKFNCKEYTGFIIFVNRILIIQYSKVQKIIETSKFSAEYIALRVYNENIESNVFNDPSGNQNYAFTFGDYKPQFDIETLKPERVSTTSRLKTSTQDGAF